MSAEPTPIDLIGVVVPVADEEVLLPACLAALDVARAAVRDADVRIVVALDACTDRSAEIVAAAPGVEAVSVVAGNVGRARDAGIRHLLRGAGDPARVWIANTDADSRVPPHWLTGMLAEARAGADLVLGTVHPDVPEGAPVEPWLLEWLARHDPSDGHGHIHGANLGIRGDRYLAIGGYAPLSHDEDVDLVGRALAAPGSSPVRTGRLAVPTSPRRRGRTPHGFAAYLTELDSAGGLAELDPAG